MLLEEAAGNTLMKDKQMNTQISSRDLTRILKRAVKECITYQTLKFSTLHKFITRKLNKTG